MLLTWSLIDSTHTSSFLEQTSHPLIIMFRAICIRPVTSSNLAAATHPGAWFGLVVITDFNNRRAFLTSLENVVPININVHMCFALLLLHIS